MRCPKFRRLLGTSVLVAATTLTPVALAQNAQPAGAKARPDGIAAEPNKVRGDELNDRQKLAVERGLAWLAARQAN